MHYTEDTTPACFVMQVLDDNVFEQRMRSHRSASSSNDAQAVVMEIDTQPEPDKIIKQHHR